MANFSPTEFMNRASLWPFAKVLNWSDDHFNFVISGKCPKCANSAISMRSLDPVSVRYYDAQGQENRVSFIPLEHQKKPSGLALYAKKLVSYQVQGVATLFGRIDSIECTKCGYRWKVRRPVTPKETSSIETQSNARMEIIETGRSEEFIGDERRVVDNSGSASPLTRNLSFSKEKLRTYKIEFEKANTHGGDLGVALPEIGSLKASCEKRISENYSVSAETKETCTEEIRCEVAARAKLTIIVQWKRIWQNGVIRNTIGEHTIEVPFAVSVGLTFDQQQLEERN